MFLKEASKKFKVRAIILLLLGFVTMYCSGMFGTDIINVIQNPLMEKLGCSGTQAVLGWTVGGYTVIFIAFVFSTIIMKNGVREFATICFFIMALGAFLVGLGYKQSSLMLVTIGGFLLKNFLQALQLSVFQVVARWFERTRGLVLGLIGAAFALDNSTSSSGLTVLYQSMGFLGMMLVATVIMMAMGVLTYVFVRTTPEELGLTVDGVEPVQEMQNITEVPTQTTQWTLGSLIRIKESWCIMLGMGIFNMTLTAVISQFFNSMVSMGLTMEISMMFMIIFGLLGIVMSPIYGILMDRMGAQKTGVLIGGLFVLSVLGFVLGIPFVAALGLTCFVGAPILQPALIMVVFGGKEYQATNRYFSMVINLIAAGGIPFMTIFYDATGSYQLAYEVLLMMNLVALGLMVLCRKTHVDHKEIQGEEKEELEEHRVTC